MKLSVIGKSAKCSRRDLRHNLRTAFGRAFNLDQLRRSFTRERDFLPVPIDGPSSISYYVEVKYMRVQPDREWKKGSCEMLILSLIEDQPRHGYEISKLIESRSGGALRFHVTTLYPLLYRLEKRGWIQGRWVEKPGQRRRRYYRLTVEGGKILAEQRQKWQEFAQAIARVAGIEYA
jgi:PadR family transcriptional regulator, regulatory protein PadR